MLLKNISEIRKRLWDRKGKFPIFPPAEEDTGDVGPMQGVGPERPAAHHGHITDTSSWGWCGCCEPGTKVQSCPGHTWTGVGGCGLRVGLPACSRTEVREGWGQLSGLWEQMCRILGEPTSLRMSWEGCPDRQRSGQFILSLLPRHPGQ